MTLSLTISFPQIIFATLKSSSSFKSHLCRYWAHKEITFTGFAKIGIIQRFVVHLGKLPASQLQNTLENKNKE